MVNSSEEIVSLGFVLMGSKGISVQNLSHEQNFRESLQYTEALILAPLLNQLADTVRENAKITCFIKLGYITL